MRRRSWIKGCNVVLSGCSTGIGKEMARILVNKEGCNIFGIARNVAKLEALKEELGDKFQFVSGDISTKESWEKIREAIENAGFKPDVLINNAGTIHPFMKFREIDDKTCETVVKTNFLSLIYSVKTMLPLLEESKKPAIVNVCSASAYLPVAGASVYSASKSAALSFTEVIKEELMGEGFYVGAVMPGPVKTELYSDRGDNKGEKKVKDNLIENVGLSAKTAAKRIIRKMRGCRTRISIGGSAGLMSGFYRAMPASSLRILGRVMRILPLETYKSMFAGEKEIRMKRKAK